MPQEQGKQWEQETYGARIRERRARLRLSMPDVAGRGGPAVTVQSKIENGIYEYNMNLRTRLAYAQALEWTQDDFERGLPTKPKKARSSEKTDLAGDLEALRPDDEVLGPMFDEWTAKKALPAVLLTIEKTVARKVEPLLAEIASLSADLAELRRQVADHLAEE